MSQSVSVCLSVSDNCSDFFLCLTRALTHIKVPFLHFRFLLGLCVFAACHGVPHSRCRMQCGSSRFVSTLPCIGGSVQRQYSDSAGRNSQHVGVGPWLVFVASARCSLMSRYCARDLAAMRARADVDRDAGCSGALSVTPVWRHPDAGMSDAM